MKYPFSKEEYLNVHDKLYDAMNDVLKDDIISNIDCKLTERNPFYRPDKEIEEKRYFTANILEWLHEIMFLKGNILQELAFTLAYNKVCNDFKESLNGTLKFINRSYYLRLVLYDLFTFREKIAFLIYQVFNRQIKGEKLVDFDESKISFYKINKGLKYINISKDNINWINNEEFEIIKDVMNKLSKNENIEKCNKIRHAFTHRSGLGIDCISLLSFESEDGKYMGGAKPLKEKVDFEEIIEDILKTWDVLVDGMETLLKNVSILNEKVSEFH